MKHEHEFPVSAIIERDEIQHGQWRVPRWRLVNFIAGEALERDGARAQLIRSEAGREQWLWTGFRLRLYRDSAESYWYNLVGKSPSLFLICQHDPDGKLVPFGVSANYAEAGAHLEADDEVFSAPIPPEIHRWLEEYVMDNYSPEPRKQRKRKNWTKEADEHGQRPQPRAPRRH